MCPRNSTPWTHWCRRHDLETYLAGSKPRLDHVRSVLELGCGDGFQTALLRESFPLVVPVDIAPRALIPGACVAAAEALPFGANSFDLVFSSNVCEHLPDPDIAMEEMARVLRPGGFLLHAVPTVAWKALQLAGHPLNLLRAGLRRVRKGRHRPRPSPPPSDDAVPVPSAPVPARTRIFPPVHGTAISHLAEWRSFREASWRRLFARHDFHPVARWHGVLHSAYEFLPFRGRALRILAGRCGVAGEVAFLLSRDRAMK